MSEERKQEIMGAVARGWCTKENENKEKDVTLATAIADEILKLRWQITVSERKNKMIKELKKYMKKYQDMRRKSEYVDIGQVVQDFYTLIGEARIKRLPKNER